MQNFDLAVATPIVKIDRMLNTTPENRSKTFYNWSEGRLFSSTPKETFSQKDTTRENKI